MQSTKINNNFINLLLYLLYHSFQWLIVNRVECQAFQRTDGPRKWVAFGKIKGAIGDEMLVDAVEDTLVVQPEVDLVLVS
jgi:hypothetical protein